MSALIGTGLAFVVATIAFLSSASLANLPAWLVPFLPLPAWILTGLLAFQGMASQLRQKYIMEIEELLARRQLGHARYPRFTTLRQGLYLPSPRRAVMNRGPVTLYYVGIVSPFLVVGSFTVFTLWSVGNRTGLPESLQIVQIVASCAYLAVGLLHLHAFLWASRSEVALHWQATARMRDRGRV